MENEKYVFKEKINGVTFLVNLRSADNAEIPVEEYIKALITDKILKIEPDVA